MALCLLLRGARVALSFALSMLVMMTLMLSDASAQCDCDHTIPLSQTVVRGDELGVQPGQTICVEAGERPFLRIRNVQGSAQAPIKIVNCGGQVVIRNTDRAYALVVEEQTRHIHLTGTGDPAHFYGFRVSAPATQPYPGVGLWFQGKSTNYEADHIEIHDTGFAGVMAKTDPLCDGSADQGVFVQRDVKLHHLLIRRAGGEGMYLGSTQAGGQRITCEGQQVTRQPHFLEGIEIHDTIIEDSGWDGAQIGMARSGCSFHHNIIRRVGAEGEQYQQQGLQLGSFSSCDVHDNIITDGPVMGIIMIGASRTRIYNNVIARFGQDSIYANDQDHPSAQDQPYLFWHNTLAGYGRNAIAVFGSRHQGSGAMNNLIIGASLGIAPNSSSPRWMLANNSAFDSLQAAGLDPDTFAPLPGSPALGAGQALAQVTHDQAGQLRPDPPALGALELVMDAPAPEPDMPVDMAPVDEPDQGAPIEDMPADMVIDQGTPPTPDMPAGGVDMDAPDSGPSPQPPGVSAGDAEEGCACATASPAAGAAQLALMLPWLVLARVRRRRADRA